MQGERAPSSGGQLHAVYQGSRHPAGGSDGEAGGSPVSKRSLSSPENYLTTKHALHTKILLRLFFLPHNVSMQLDECSLDWEGGLRMVCLKVCNVVCSALALGNLWSI